MGQTCYQAVILQALLHDPTLNAYFLAGGHDVHTCQRPSCLACATAEVFTDFNSGERAEAVSAATLLYYGWDASKVCGHSDERIEQPANFFTSRKWLDTASKMHTNTFSS
jgi:hypothetical protein